MTHGINKVYYIPMTIEEAKIALVEYFKDENKFSLTEFNKYFLLVEDVDFAKLIVKEAADDLVKAGILRQIMYLGDTYYVLNRSLEDYEQQVNITAVTAQTVAKIINDFREETQEESNACDVLNISDNDIQNALKILLIKLELMENFEGEE